MHEAGKATAAVLAELLPQVCQRITFPKSMRWGAGEISFGRPIHWVVSLLGGDVVEFEFAGVQAGRATRGHRFLAPETFDLDEADNYETALERAHVLVDLEVRKARMMEGLLASAKSLGGVLEPDAFLADECVSLVEEPFTVPGSFERVVSRSPRHRSDFGDARSPAILCRTRVRRRALCFRRISTWSTPRRTRRRSPKATTECSARAWPMHASSSKRTAKRRSPTVFRSSNPSCSNRSSARWAPRFGGCKPTPVPSQNSWESTRRPASKPRALCKADLETLIVFEFPELQGEMGRWYALREGIDAAIADAIRDHYRPQGADDVVPDQIVGAVVAVADRIDTLVGCFGIGLVPSGSADPFALRRAALGIIRIALEGPIDVDLRRLIDQAYAAYAGDAELAPPDEVRATLDSFFRGRIRAMLKDAHGGDVVDACLGAWDGTSVRDLRSRIEAVSELGAAPEFEALADRVQARLQHHEGERAWLRRLVHSSKPERRVHWPNDLRPFATRSARQQANAATPTR